MEAGNQAAKASLGEGPNPERKPCRRAIALLLPRRRAPEGMRDRGRRSLLLDAVKDRRSGAEVGEVLKGVRQRVVEQRPPGDGRGKVAGGLQRVVGAGHSKSKEREVAAGTGGPE